MADFDAVVVGSGVNGLACGALLAKAGWRVAVVERSDRFGGCIRSEELTEPGFLHDTLSAWHPLWVGGPAHAQLADDLAARGLEYLNTDVPTGTAYPDGSAAFLLRDAEGNARELGEEWHGVLERFFPNADLAFGVLGTELWSPGGLAFGAKALRRLGRGGTATFTGELLQTARDWLTDTFASPQAWGVLAPWVLHTGLGPDAATSGFMTQVIAVAVQEGGMPIPRGGGARLAEALVQLIRDHGGVCETGVDVDRVLVQSRRAAGIRAAGGETYTAERAVIANTTPTQLYERLLADAQVPAPVRAGVRRFRYGRAEMQIHFALSEPARWEGDERLNRAAIVHVTPGLNGVSKAVNEAERGELPDEATIVVGQPLTIDPSRAPDGKGLLWIQLQELPRDFEWNDDARERYADRIQARLARHIQNLESSILKRVALGPHDLERLNVNLVGGDPYGGALSLDQNFLWRPFAEAPGHATAIDGLWHVGASTWPGPGLGGGSGALVAQALLKPPLAGRLRPALKQVYDGVRTRRSNAP
jgi:phytoene dehydrogenase-like protein